MMGPLYEATGNNCHYQSGSGEKDRKFLFIFPRAPCLNIATGESAVEDALPPSQLIITLIGFRE